MENWCIYYIRFWAKIAALSSSCDRDHDSKAQKLRIFTLWPFKTTSAGPCLRWLFHTFSFPFNPFSYPHCRWQPCFLLHWENWSHEERFQTSSTISICPTFPHCSPYYYRWTIQVSQSLPQGTRCQPLGHQRTLLPQSPFSLHIRFHPVGNLHLTCLLLLSFLDSTSLPATVSILFVLEAKLERVLYVHCLWFCPTLLKPVRSKSPWFLHC